MMRWHRRLYDWVLHWASTPSAGTALFLLALAESSFFPIPPDVLLAAVVMSDRRRTWRSVLLCTLGSVVGGALGYCIGWGFWEATKGFFFRFVPGFTPAVYARVAGLYEHYNFWVVFTAGFTPIPYKVFTIGAGVAIISFPTFLLASTISRGGRFLLVASLFHHYGPPIRGFVDRYLGWLTVAFVTLLVGGFAVLSYLG
ncbi:MAG TPA: YqaA family protein [Candidatus Polarisedimenticolia bacterium]|nr:YqaA family protein [Candidatus Polarisedimenticolia bacterium]